MLRKEKDGVIWLEFELLAQFQNLVHGVFLRHGGYSEGPYGTLNFSYSVGDSAINVSANEQKIQQILQLDQIVRTHLCHGKEICHVAKGQSLAGEPYDAMSTSSPAIGLLITHADCQAAIFYDPVNHAVANIHAGWRGNVQNIYSEAVRFMANQYGTLPKDLIVGISPSLGPRDAEFINYRTELPEHFWDFQVSPHYFDFWAIAKMQLKQCGVLERNIEIAGISTYSNPQDFFSYRREKQSGRHATVVALRK